MSDYELRFIRRNGETSCYRTADLGDVCDKVSVNQLLQPDISTIEVWQDRECLSQWSRPGQLVRF